MTKEIKEDGGPAFPTDSEHQPAAHIKHFEGMTLRDYFAAKAMLEVYRDFASEAEKNGWLPDWRGGVAKDAYSMADAMIEERDK